MITPGITQVNSLHISSPVGDLRGLTPLSCLKCEATATRFSSVSTEPGWLFPLVITRSAQNAWLGLRRDQVLA